MPRVREPGAPTADDRPPRLEKGRGQVGSDVPGTQVPSVRGHLRVSAEGSERGDDEGVPRDARADPALEFLREDARRRNQSFSKYLRAAGILTPYQEALIRQREVPLDVEQ